MGARVHNPPEHSSFTNWALRQANPSKAYPAVFEVWSTPAGGGTNVRPSDEWIKFEHDVNVFMGTEEGHELSKVNWSGRRNSASNPDYAQGEVIPDDGDPRPKFEGIITTWNPVKVIEKKNRASRIEIFDYTKPPPRIEDVNPRTHRHLFDHMRSVDADGNVGNAPEGKEFWFPRLARFGVGWVPDSILEYGEWTDTDEPVKESSMGLPNHWAFGLDISKYDQSFNRSLSERVIDFIVQRRSYADGVKVVEDERADLLYPAVREVNRRIGYHYWSGYQSLNEQVDVYLESVQGKEFHAHAADFETMVNPITEASAIGCLDWMRAVGVETGQRVLLYSKRQEWIKFKSIWQGVDIWPKFWPFEWWLNTGYDAAATVNKYWGPDLPEHWIHQYGGDDPVVAGWNDAAKWGVGYITPPGENKRLHVDLDVFNGSPAAMSEWLGIGSEPEPVPTPPVGEDNYNEAINDSLAAVEALRRS